MFGLLLIFYVPFFFFPELFPVRVNCRQKEAASQEVLISKLQASLAQVQDRCRAQEQVGHMADSDQHPNISVSPSPLMTGHCFLLDSMSHHGPCGLYFHIR